MQVNMSVNGAAAAVDVEPRRTLADALREDLGLTGTHLGCEHGVCGACTVMVDGQPVRSCLMFAVQADGSSVTTIEGLASDSGELHAVQKAFCDKHGLQCGFCTPGMLISALDLLHREEKPSRERIREEMSGNICRCTGYVGIVDAVEQAAQELADWNACGVHVEGETNGEPEGAADEGAAGTDQGTDVAAGVPPR
jgi:carbon-monoxide dehydrogenase small subunit